VPKPPLAPAELIVQVNGKPYDYLGIDPRAQLSGIIRVVEGQRIRIKVSLVIHTSPNAISEVLEWVTKPEIYCKDVLGERYVQTTEYEMEFIARPFMFDERTKEVCFTYCYAGGDRVRVRGWRVRGWWIFTWGQFGEFETRTTASPKREVWFKLVE